MTHLDNGIAKFPNLVSLNLCGNYIAALDINALPPDLRILELQANRISNLESFCNLPQYLLYLGLARNLLTNGNIAQDRHITLTHLHFCNSVLWYSLNFFAESNLDMLSRLPLQISVVDLSDNDIYDLEPVIDALTQLRTLRSLVLAGNPCSVTSTLLSTLRCSQMALSSFLS